MTALEQMTWLNPPSTANPMSREAADAILGSAASLRRAVAECIARHGPVAEWEIERHLDAAGNTIRPRVWELHQRGLTARSGTGRTPSGRRCHLYVLTDEGRRAVGAGA